MTRILNLQDANIVLSKYIPDNAQAKKYSLYKITSLMEYLGNPQNNLKVVHIAGTSGKTSTSYYIAKMLNIAGYKVGLTISPHIDEINERVQIDNNPLNAELFCSELEVFLGLIKKFDQKPTYFEILIAFVYWEFNRQKVDYAVVEVGLGGLLDGTNVINRSDKICVITDIGLDHTQILGNTISKIARQKGGIILPRNKVYMYTQSREIMLEINKIVKHKDAVLVEIDQSSINNAPKNLPLFQKRNWFLAFSVVVSILKTNKKPILNHAQLQESSEIVVPARMEIFNINSKTIIVDGSHNEQKIQALIESIKDKYGSQKLATLISFGQNKQSEINLCLKLLAGISSQIIVTKFSFGQDEIRLPIDPKDIITDLELLDYKNTLIESDPLKAFQLLLNRPEKLLLITGSFYLLNHIRPAILYK